MSLLGALENGLFAVSQLLRFPVIVLLWVCIAAALYMSAALVVETLARRRERRRFDLAEWIEEGPVLRASDERLSHLPAALRAMIAEIRADSRRESFADGGLEHVVLEREERAHRTLRGSRVLIKVGPSLGLLGTLIPMGTALASLTAGNLEAMAGQMVVAFTTTIVGLSAGTAAFVIQLVRHSWVNQHIREQRLLAERIAGEIEREI